RILGLVLRRGGDMGQGVAIALERLLEIGAVVLLEGSEDLVELDRRARLRGGDRVAAREVRRLWAPRPQVEEEVALQEETGTNRDRGVLVDRLALVVDREGDIGHVALARDAHDLPDGNAGDAKRGVRLERRRVLECGVELVAAARER